MKKLAFAILLICAGTTFAQEVGSLPDAVIPKQNISSSLVAMNDGMPFAMANGAVASTALRPQRVADKKFVAVQALHATAAVLDIESTQHCLRAKTCSEGNPLMPSSRAGAYSMSFALVTGEGLMSYLAKRQHKAGWALGPIIGTTAHVTGFTMNSIRFGF